MRWNELFADLEAQWDAEQRRDLDAEVADRTRRERATVTLRERFAGAAAHGGAADPAPVTLTVRTGAVVTGAVLDVGDGWVLVGPAVRGTAPPGPTVLVPLHAVVAVAGLDAKAADGGLGRSFGLGYALRALSRDRSVVAVTDASGATATGTIDAVWADALELSEHPADLPRRPEHVTGRRLVPFGALVLVRAA